MGLFDNTQYRSTNGVFYRGPLYVKGFYGTVDFSWSIVDTGNEQWLTSCYGGGRFVIAGAAVKGVSVNRGNSWSKTNDVYAWYGSAYDVTNSLYILFGTDFLGTNGYTAYSSDASSWTYTDTSTVKFRDGIYGNGIVVAVGDGYTATANDGYSWSNTATTGKNWSGACYNGNDDLPQYVIIGQTNAGYSSDGSSWSFATGISSNNLNDVAYGNGLYVGVGSGGSVVYSSNGSSWTEISTGTQDWNGVAFTDPYFVAVGLAGKTAYSSDGINWTELDTGVHNWYDVVFGETRYIAVGSDGYTAHT